MPIALFGLGMFVSHPAPFQPFIYLNSMPSMQTLPNTIYEPFSRAGARALRVGIGEHVGHANYSAKMLACCHLQTLHAQAPRVDGHVSRCQTTRNLLRPGAIAAGAPVPRGIFTALSRKFYGTLTPWGSRFRV